MSTKLDYDLYINIQGDEPIIDPMSISQIIDSYQKYGDEYMVYNLYKVIADEHEINNKTIIKVIVNKYDDVIYMSRLPIPFSNSDSTPHFKQQIPVYGLTKKALDVFSKQSKTLNEQYEDVELLRFIDLGYKIKMQETTVDSIAVDVPSDIQKVENFLNQHEIKTLI